MKNQKCPNCESNDFELDYAAMFPTEVNWYKCRKCGFRAGYWLAEKRWLVM